MNFDVVYRESYTFSLVPERAELFQRWAAHHGVSPQEHFLRLLAMGVGMQACVDLGLSLPQLPTLYREDWQETILEALAERLLHGQPGLEGDDDLE
jgi:non-ribosomal peptide synthetase component F